MLSFDLFSAVNFRNLLNNQSHKDFVNETYGEPSCSDLAKWVGTSLMTQVVVPGRRAQ